MAASPQGRDFATAPARMSPALAAGFRGALFVAKPGHETAAATPLPRPTRATCGRADHPDPLNLQISSQYGRTRISKRRHPLYDAAPQNPHEFGAPRHGTGKALTRKNLEDGVL